MRLHMITTYFEHFLQNLDFVRFLQLFYAILSIMFFN